MQKIDEVKKELPRGYKSVTGVGGRRFCLVPTGGGGKLEIGTKGSISHGDTLSCLSLATDSSHSTFINLHDDSGHLSGSASPISTIVPEYLKKPAKTTQKLNTEPIHRA